MKDRLQTTQYVAELVLTSRSSEDKNIHHGNHASYWKAIYVFQPFASVNIDPTTLVCKETCPICKGLTFFDIYLVSCEVAQLL